MTRTYLYILLLALVCVIGLAVTVLLSPLRGPTAADVVEFLRTSPYDKLAILVLGSLCAVPLLRGQRTS